MVKEAETRHILFIPGQLIGLKYFEKNGTSPIGKQHIIKEIRWAAKQK
jgi:hypothetical protein